jgi:hypothetical protein
VTDDHAPHAKPRSRHRDLLAALVSGFVGFVALATSTYNVYLQRQQVRAQVWPYLVLGADWGHEGFTLGVTNRGVGPAAVKRVTVTVDGKLVEDWVDAEARLLRSDHLTSNWNIHEIDRASRSDDRFLGSDRTEARSVRLDHRFERNDRKNDPHAVRSSKRFDRSDDPSDRSSGRFPRFG